MPFQLNFKRVAREAAIDFFAPLTGLYRVLVADLATAREVGPCPPARAADNSPARGSPGVADPLSRRG